jgi:hypothetical protein
MIACAKGKAVLLAMILATMPFLLAPGGDNGKAPEVEWQKTYGGTISYMSCSITASGDGGYVVAGVNSSKEGDFDFCILKLDRHGDKIWDKIYGGPRDDWAFTVTPDGDGGYIVGGYNASFGAGAADIWILKLDSQGNRIWDKTYGGTGAVAFSIISTDDGGYIVAGLTHSFGDSDCWILKLDRQGNKIWDKTYGGGGKDWAKSIVPTGDGGYIVAGTTSSFGSGKDDFWILKLDSQGNKIWDKTYGGAGDDRASSIMAAGDGGYIVAGTTNSFGVGNDDFWILKLDNQGEKIWEKTYGGSGDDQANSIIAAGDGGYIVAGTTESIGTDHKDFRILKLDPQGKEVWDKIGAESGESWASSIIAASDGGYVVAGMTRSPAAGIGDFWVMKLGPDAVAP